MRSVLRQKQQIIHRARIQGVLSHPKARKIKQLQRSIRRTDARFKVLQSIKGRRNHDEEQLFWIAAAMQRLGVSPNRQSYVDENNITNRTYENDDGPGLLPIVMEALVHIYVHRNDKEYNELKNKRQPPRGELRKIEIQKEKEATQFQNGKGFLVPPFSTRSEVDLVMEWFEAVMEYEEANINGTFHNNLTPEEQKQFTKQMPNLPPAYVLRTSTKTSKKGNVTPTEDFLQLVDQLMNQDGIGNHLIQDDDELQKMEKQKDDSNADNNDDDDNNNFDVSNDLEQRKKKRRRFGKLRTAVSRDDDEANTGSNNNSDKNQGAKTINVQDMALRGMARRFTATKTDREQRRKDALKAARTSSD